MSQHTQKKLLVTAALPYANGALHLGHVLEHVATDVFVRAQKSMGRDAVFLCADDTHGTPIEINAGKQGKTPEAFIAEIAVDHKRDFADFQIDHVYYGSTHTPENQKYAELFLQRLTEKGHITKRDVEQFFCEKDQRFLADRFIKGTCPNCGAPDQYGDVCENCSKTHSPDELKDPRCALCGTPPVKKKSQHYFVKLGDFTEFLGNLTASGFLHPVVQNSLQPWIKEGLKDWDISRDGPYFGFKIPGEDNKFFYVWLDAPIGYISNTERWLKAAGKGDALTYWAPEADAEIIHVIGKDIVYFHTLFWPAMLQAAGFKLPSRVVVHGMLLANGEKMSKSRGTGINARDYLAKLDPMYLRYFLAANLGPSPEDIDLSLEEFRNRVNADLVNNFGNLANRALSILKKNFGGKLAPTREWGDVKLAHARQLAQKAADAFSAWETREAVRFIKEIGDWANKAIADAEPWKQLAPTADPAARAAAHVQVSFAAEASALLGALLQPIVPGFTANLFKQLNVAPVTIAQALAATGPLLPVEHEIGEPAPLAPRLDPKLVDTLFTPPTEAPAPKTEKKSEKKEPPKKAEPPAVIQYDDFGKLDLRVGKVLSCSKVEKADKLLQFSIDLGEAQPRTIVSGIAKHYAPEQLVGKQVVIVANLAPREFKKQGLTSHGMILSAATGEGDAEKLTVVEIPASVPPGSKVA